MLRTVHAGMLRMLCLALVLGLGGCGIPPLEAVGAVAAADLASVAVFGRGLGDLVYSGATGRDCSVVRLEQGKTYCRPAEPPPSRPPFCTRSLGRVDCWTNPEALNDHPREVADGPLLLTPEQERNRTRRWPDF